MDSVAQDSGRHFFDAHLALRAGFGAAYPGVCFLRRHVTIIAGGVHAPSERYSPPSGRNPNPTLPRSEPTVLPKRRSVRQELNLLDGGVAIPHPSGGINEPRKEKTFGVVARSSA